VPANGETQPAEYEVMAQRAAYFVRHLIPGEVPEAGSFEIQLLDRVGRGVAVGYLDGLANGLKLEGRDVPAAVINATLGLPIGVGIFITADGECVDHLGRAAEPFPSDREQLAGQLLEAGQRLIETGVPGGRLRLEAVVSYYGDTRAAEKARDLIAK